VRYLGRDWELYPSLPAKPVLRILRLQADGAAAGTLSYGEMLTFLTELVPPEVLDAWLEQHMTVTQMADLIRRVIAIYNGQEADPQETSGEAASPSTSSTGAPSKPTTPASIASTCPEPSATA